MGVPPTVVFTVPRFQSNHQEVPAPPVLPPVLTAVPSTNQLTAAGVRLMVAVKRAGLDGLGKPDGGVTVVTEGPAERPGFGTVVDCRA